MFNTRDSENFRQGYRYGEQMSLKEEACPPKDLTKEQESEWQKGVNAAICDRLG